MILQLCWFSWQAWNSWRSFPNSAVGQSVREMVAIQMMENRRRVLNIGHMDLDIDIVLLLRYRI